MKTLKTNLKQCKSKQEFKTRQKKLLKKIIIHNFVSVDICLLLFHLHIIINGQ